MKTKYYFSILYLIATISVLLRTVQIFQSSDVRTGFFVSSKPLFLSFLLFLLTIVFGGFAFKIKRCPLKMPRVNTGISVSSFLVGVCMFVRAFSLYTKIGGFSFSQIFNIIVIAVNIIVGVFFLLYSAKKFVYFHIKRIFYIAPLIYWIILMIYSYVRISKTPIISENALMILATTSTTVFMLYFAKIANNINSNSKRPKLLMLLGFLSATFCETFAIPQLIAIVAGKQSVLHNDFSFMLVFVSTGIFVLTFLNAFFANSNLIKRKRNNDESARVLPTELSPKNKF
ncbi:MAG: hypothetical protein MJ090_04345 [Clostridia bacterium]|nr:hypothetical protein [Clostridia bacterium]